MNKRYWSLSSLLTVSSELLDVSTKEEEISTIEDVIKFFIFVLLMLFHALDYPKFCKDLMQNISKNKWINLGDFRPPLKPTMDVDLNDLNKSKIACGQAHVAYIHNEALYTWGKSGSGRLGTENVGMEYQSPQPVLTFLRLQINVLAVSCGALHTLVLTDFGLFAWGSSRYGQLGMGEVQQTVQPRIIESLLPECIVKVECGQYHSIALTSSGKVFTWGWGIHGQLGHGNAEDIVFPKLIESLKRKKIVSVGAGQGHTILLSKNGDVYAFGCGMFGQLGNGSVLKQSHPQFVNIPERIKLIASGHFHVLAVSRINKVYTWGCNPQALRLQAQNSRRARHHGAAINQNCGSSNQTTATMGYNALQKSMNSPVQQSHLLPNLVNIPLVGDAVCQLSCGSHHSVLVTSSGRIFSWGRNSEGQIGNGTRKEQKIPCSISNLKDKKIIDAACGADFTIAIDSSGRIFGWGQNDGGQIGQKPALEVNAKHNSASSSGRVITIRTNRRMITITQPCRQSILRPVEIAVPLCDVKRTGIFDSGSFDNENTIKLLNQNFFSNKVIQDFPDLSKLDTPCYGPYALHTALELFHVYCNSSSLLNHCLNFRNFQAAAKVCVLEKAYDQALEYQLKALELISGLTTDVILERALQILDFYSNLLDHENVEQNLKFLNNVARFWLKNNLPMTLLESFFQSHSDIFTYPLCLIMFSDDVPALDSKSRTEFLNLLSTRFCLAIMSEVLGEIEHGSRLPNLLNEKTVLSDTTCVLNQIHVSDALTTWDDSIPQERLWSDIIHNLQTGVISHAAITLTSNDVDLLVKSLLNEKVYSQSFNNTSSTNKLNSNGKNSVIFSCGHYHTLPAFQSNVLPLFKESLHNFFYSIPQTTKLLLSEYQEDMIAAACPRCVMAEISNV